MDNLTTKQFVNKFLLLGVFTYFFILFEVSLIQLANISFAMLGIVNFIAVIVLSLFVYIFLLGVILKSRRSKVFFSLFIFLFSGAGLFLLLGTATYTIEQFWLCMILLFGVILTVLIFNLFKMIGTKKLIVVVATIGFAVFVLYIVFVNKLFLWSIIQFLVLFVLSSYSLKTSIKTASMGSGLKIMNLSRGLKIALILTSFLCCFSLFGSATVVNIEANNSPELIFWTDVSGLPDDDETLNYCAEHDVGFCAVMRESMVDAPDFGAQYVDDIEMVLNHSVILYICVGGETGQFFATTDNSETMLDSVKSVRSWMRTNNLYNYDNFEGFCLDAEIQRDIGEKSMELDTTSKVGYLMSEIPSERIIQKAENDYKELVDLIQDDDKRIGIIKLRTTNDHLDNDGDLNGLSHTIYMLQKPNWDFSVSMNYRTWHVPNLRDVVIEDMSQYDYTSEHDTEYLKQSAEQRTVVPMSQFFKEVCYEVSSSEVGVKSDNRYIFIGNFDIEFKETIYIKEKEYQKDLDVCRHFGVKSVWLYEWRTFKRQYGDGELRRLVKHNENKQEWQLIMPTYIISREFFLDLSMIFADKLLYVY